MPFGGKNQLTPAEGMAAHLPVKEGKTKTTSLMSFGFDPVIAHWSPFHGGLYAVLDSVTRLTAMGGDYRKVRLTLQEYFEKLKKDPRRWGKPLAALLGAYTAEDALALPAIGGKDSMSGSFNDLHVPPCLLSFAVALADDDRIISPEWKGAGHRLILLLSKRDENLIPDFKRQKEIYEKVMDLNERGLIHSAISLRSGGIAEALIHASLGNAIGADINDMDLEDLLAPRYGSILLEVDEDIDMSDPLFIPVGRTVAERRLRHKGEEILLVDLVQAYLTALNDVYPPFLPSEGDSALCPTYDKQLYVHSDKKVKPKVLIPVFPGTNCEYDSADAFTLAGADADVLVVRNQTPAQLRESVAAPPVWVCASEKYA